MPRSFFKLILKLTFFRNDYFLCGTTRLRPQSGRDLRAWTCGKMEGSDNNGQREETNERKRQKISKVWDDFKLKSKENVVVCPLEDRASIPQHHVAHAAASQQKTSTWYLNALFGRILGSPKCSIATALVLVCLHTSCIRYAVHGTCW